MTTRCTNGGQRVPAVAGLCQGVGAEAQAHAFIDNVIDDIFFGPFIEVVHQLCALVAEESSVFKPYGAFHNPNGSRPLSPHHEQRTSLRS